MKRLGSAIPLGIALGFGCERPPERVLPPPALEASAPPVASSAEAPPPPTRSYVRGPNAVAVVDDTGATDAAASLSPDGLLVALHPGSSPFLLFYDIDRRRIVGRTGATSSQIGSDPPLWLGDGHVLVSGYGSEALFDARTGALVGEVPNGVHAAIATRAGFATLAKSDTAAVANLVLFADPKRSLARIDVEGYVRAAYDIGEGAFLYVSPSGAFAFEANGRARFHKAGDYERATVEGAPNGTLRLHSRRGEVVVSLRDGAEIQGAAREPAMSVDKAARVKITSDGVFEPGKVAGEPLVRLQYPRGTRAIEPTGRESFAARCENGATATLGSVTTVPPGIASEPKGELQTTLLSKTGSHRASWASGKIVLTALPADTSRTLDAGVGIQHVAFHPNGKALVTAAHLLGFGMGWHPDPDASVRVFDLASGALNKRLVGNDFFFSDDGSKLVVLGSDDATVYDAASYQKQRSWPGVDPDVALDPSGRFAVVKIHRRPEGGLGPHEVASTFVEDLTTKRRVISLAGRSALHAFDAAGGRIAIAARAHDLDENVRSIAIHELPSGKVVTTVRIDEPIERLALLGDGKVLAAWTRTGLRLHRLGDGRKVTLYAVPDAKACRLFAVSDDQHFQGDPGGRLAYRYGDDLRTSEIVPASAESARADSSLLEKHFAGR